MDYESKQVATWELWLAAPAAAAGIVIGVVYALAGRWESAIGLWVLFMALVLANFAVLTVRVSDREVRWTFGRGPFGRLIPLERVRGVEVLRSPWYWGWGIRWTPRGWLWRSTGLDVVWLELENGKRVGVGSADPQRLAHAISERLSVRS